MRGAVVVFVAVALLTLLRLFFGAEVTDESNYVAHAHTFLIDGRLFHSDLFIQGTAEILISPIVALYERIWGTEGLVVLLRMLFYMWALAASLAAFQFFKRYYSRDLALLAASLNLAYIPFSVGSWSYNNVPSIGVPLSLFLLFSGSSAGALVGGIVAAMSCFAYPTISVLYGILLVWMWARRRKVPREIADRGKIVFTAMIVLGGVVSAYFISQGLSNFSKVVAFTKEFQWVGGLSKLNTIFDYFQRGGWRSGMSFFLLGGLFLKYKKQLNWMWRWDPWVLAGAAIWCLFSTITPQGTLGFMLYFPLTLLVFYGFGRFNRTRDSGPNYTVKVVLTFSFIAAAVHGYTSSNMLANAGLGMTLALQVLLLEAVTSFRETGRGHRPEFLFVFVAVVLGLGNWFYVYRDERVWKLDTVVQSGPFRFIRTTWDRAEMLEDLDRDLKKMAVSKGSIFASYLTPAYFSTWMKPVTGMLFIADYKWRPSAVSLILHRTVEKDEWPDLVVTKIVDEVNFDYQFERFFTESGKYDLAISKPWYRILVKK